MMGSLASSRATGLVAAPSAPLRAGEAGLLGCSESAGMQSESHRTPPLALIAGFNCAAGRVLVPSVECKALTRQQRVAKRHFRIRKKVCFCCALCGSAAAAVRQQRCSSTLYSYSSVLMAAPAWQSAKNKQLQSVLIEDDAGRQ